jgi:hypothetical protein
MKLINYHHEFRNYIFNLKILKYVYALIRWTIHNPFFIFLKLMITPLNTIRTEVFTVIKEKSINLKKILPHLPQIKLCLLNKQGFLKRGQRYRLKP